MGFSLCVHRESEGWLNRQQQCLTDEKTHPCFCFSPLLPSASLLSKPLLCPLSSSTPLLCFSIPFPKETRLF